ncbi:hypothetical protein DFJ74DRAFT_764190, partial [Hyaloraphidium curvatum]
AFLHPPHVAPRHRLPPRPRHRRARPGRRRRQGHRRRLRQRLWQRALPHQVRHRDFHDQEGGRNDHDHHQEARYGHFYRHGAGRDGDQDRREHDHGDCHGHRHGHCDGHEDRNDQEGSFHRHGHVHQDQVLLGGRVQAGVEGGSWDVGADSCGLDVGGFWRELGQAS